jgi:hypothetical protein
MLVELIQGVEALLRKSSKFVSCFERALETTIIMKICQNN